MNDFREYKASFLEQNDLAHFGILGMKWGVRRYQNPDGTLTQAGKRRYNILMSKGKIEKAKKYGTETKEEREKRLEDSNPKLKEQKIKKKLETAKKSDLWDLDFLEAVQNDWFMVDDPMESKNSNSPGAKQAMLKEYEKYLKDPEKYWQNH